MKHLPFTLLLAGLLIICGPRLHSQNPAAPKTALEQLQMVRQQNQTLLEKQAATLLTLEAMEKQAAQIKFLTKRT